jgi:hypothetical protein
MPETKSQRRRGYLSSAQDCIIYDGELRSKVYEGKLQYDSRMTNFKGVKMDLFLTEIIFHHFSGGIEEDHEITRSRLQRA